MVPQWTAQRQQRRAVALWLYITSILLHVVYASSSSSVAASNYNVYHYDTTTPQFTPDGRLLQVEYATAAADHSSPLLVCRINNDTLVLLSLQQTTTSLASPTLSSPQKSRRGKVQDRLVVMDGRVVVAMSGVLADSMALLKAASQEWLGWKRIYGDDGPDQSSRYSCQFPLLLPNDDSSSRTRSIHMHRVVAQAMGNKCQKHAFGGGIRPYGSTILVAAMLPTNDGSNNEKDGDKDTPQSPFCLLQTDPSGAVSSISLPSLREETTNQSPELVTIIGGSPDARSKLEKNLNRSWSSPASKWRRSSSKNNQSTTDNHHFKTLQAMTRVLVQHHQREIQQEEKGRSRKSTGTESQQDGGTSAAHWWLEAVILSREHGIHRLTDSQVQALLESVVGGEF